MHSTLSHSTHFRPPCNFNTDGLVTTDYLRAKTTDLNILQLNSYPCVKMEYINIRGYDCYDCTARMIQKINWHLHVDYNHRVKSCQFKSTRNGSVASPAGEDNTDAPRRIMLQRSGGLEKSKFLYQTRQTLFTKQKHRTHNLQTQRFHGLHFKKTQGYLQQPFWSTKK